MDERRPALVHSSRKPEELVYKVPLHRHVMPGHGTHLALGQYAIASMPARVRRAVQKF